MKLFNLKDTIDIPISLDEAWKFFATPLNLSKITPPELGLKFTDENFSEMYPGMIVEYTVFPIGPIPCNWVTEILHVEKHRYFIDEQRFGPYRFWHHQHHFHEIPGGTRVSDIVNYHLPIMLGLEPIFHKLVIAPKLKEIFDYRRKSLVEIFGHFS